MQEARYQLSGRVRASAAPPIPLAAQWAAEYSPTADDPLINLSQGVPGAPPPQAMLDKLADATRDPTSTGYGALAGDVSLRLAVANNIERVYGPAAEEDDRVTADNVAITAGCNLASTSSPLSSPRFDLRTGEGSYSCSLSVTGFLCYGARPRGTGRRDHPPDAVVL